MSEPAADVASVINRVTVHRSDALVRRVAEVGGRPLPLSVRVGPLPLAIHPGSVRAAVTTGDAGLPAAAATVHLAVEPVGGRGLDRPDLEQAVHDAQRAVDATASEAERLRGELSDARERLAPVGRERARTGDRDLVLADRQVVPAERRLALLRFADEHAVILGRQLVDAEAAHRNATRALAEATDRWNAARHDAGRPHELIAIAVVTLQGAGRLPDDAVLEVSYLVSGATWRPSHRLHLDGDRSTLTIGGVVLQQTGEDWVGALLELSTTDPRLNWDLPDLKPVRIGRAAPPVRGWKAPEPLPAELFADFDTAAAAAEEALAIAAPVTVAYASAGEPITAPVPAVPPPLGAAAPMELAETGDRAAMVERTAAPSMPMPPMAMPSMPVQAMPAPAMPTAAARGRAKSKRMRSSPAGVPAAPPAGARAVLPGLDDPGPGDPGVDSEPDRPGAEVADLDRLVLPPAAAPGRGRPRRGPDAGPAEVMARARGEAGAALTRTEWATDRARWRGGAVACLYRTPGRVDIPSSRATSTVVVAELGVTPTDEYVTVPHQSSDVFHTVVLTNPHSVAVVGGPVDVSGPDGYIGSAEIESLAPGAEARIGIGVEDGIGVEREVEHREDARGMRRNNRSLVHEVQVRLTNRLGHAARVVVRERVPITPDTDDRMSVNELAVDPPWQPYERPGAILRGGRQWSVDIEPASSVELRAEWEIVIPARHEIEGGNRR